MIKISTSNWASKRMLSTILRVIIVDDGNDSKERSFWVLFEGKFMCKIRRVKLCIKIILSTFLTLKNCHVRISFLSVVWWITCAENDGMRIREWAGVVWVEGWFCHHNEKYISYNNDKRTCWHCLKRWRYVSIINWKLILD